jgi:hypothetical protein
MDFRLADEVTCRGLKMKEVKLMNTPVGLTRSRVS